MKLKIQNLELIKKLIEERSTFEDSLQARVRWYDKFRVDKSTQTEEIKLTEQEYKMPSS